MAFVKVALLDQVKEGQPFLVRVESQRFCLVRLTNKIFAFNDSCPHKGGSLSEGRMEEGLITCPLHQWKFDVKTGQCPGTASVKVRTFPVRIKGMEVLVDVPDPYA